MSRTSKISRFYHIVPNFRGTTFSWISILQIFAEINFVDEGFSLATPTLGSYVHYLCFKCLILSCLLPDQSVLLRDELCLESSRFRSLELTNYTSQAGDICPLTNAMGVEETYEGDHQNLEAFAVKQR